MTAARPVIAVVWLALAAVPFLWWLRSRRQLDVWHALPVPAALLDRDGAVTRRAGPESSIAFDLRTGLPARDCVVRTRTNDGTWIALRGVRDGALALALPGDAVVERRDQVLAELGARLAHDINTPLGALHGHLDLIAHEPISEAASASVRTCQRELVRLQTTAQDLLAFTRLRAGGGIRSPHLAGALAEEAAAALLDLVDASDAELTVVVPADPVRVHVAEADLVRALRNLISNAVAHGLGSRREVRVEVTADEDVVMFAVVDSGSGLTQTQLDELSQPLARGDTTAPGSGLGLAIVAEVLAAHGSRLVAEPGHPSGPAVTFCLARLP